MLECFMAGCMWWSCTQHAVAKIKRKQKGKSLLKYCFMGLVNLIKLFSSTSHQGPQGAVVKIHVA